ncbi:MAG: hypothetical protein IKP40_05500 [Clostridia bacterium]|nr:hypothetical protein [Clostridia bacterium]
MRIAFLIWSAIALLFAGFGLHARSARQAVPFFAGVKPEEIQDVAGYNRALSKLWFIAAVVFELLGLPLLFSRQNAPVILLSVLGTVFLMLVIGVLAMKTGDRFREKGANASTEAPVENRPDM